MPRVPALVTFALAGVVTAAPIPDVPTLPFYHPTRVGDRREYVTKTGNLVVRVVSKAEQKDGVWTVTDDLVPPAGGPKSSQTWQVSGAGVASVDTSSNGKHDALRWVLKLPAGGVRPPGGLKWEWNLLVPTGGVTHAYNLSDEEQVVVPAGTFRAVRVDLEESGLIGGQPTRTVRVARWYAPRVGVVKEVGTADGMAASAMELKSFTPGKN